jgi:uncharacterized Zn finger protein
MREDAFAKGQRYLTEGRLTVDHVDATRVLATCRGDGARYDVGWTEEFGWSCSCPALGRCAHLRALMLVTVRGGGTE